MQNGPNAYYTREILVAIDEATTFDALRAIAFRVLAQMPPDAGMVCGPITTGGAGSIDKNLFRFARAIDILAKRGENIFTQMPFETAMQRIKTIESEREKDFNLETHATTLLESFYLPIFRSGYIDRLFFLPDWTSSFGARWEHDRANEIGLSRIYLGQEFAFTPIVGNYPPLVSPAVRESLYAINEQMYDGFDITPWPVHLRVYGVDGEMKGDISEISIEDEILSFVSGKQGGGMKLHFSQIIGVRNTV